MQCSSVWLSNRLENDVSQVRILSVCNQTAAPTHGLNTGIIGELYGHTCNWVAVVVGSSPTPCPKHMTGVAQLVRARNIARMTISDLQFDSTRNSLSPFSDKTRQAVCCHSNNPGAFSSFHPGARLREAPTLQSSIGKPKTFRGRATQYEVWKNCMGLHANFLGSNPSLPTIWGDGLTGKGTRISNVHFATRRPYDYLPITYRRYAVVRFHRESEHSTISS